MELLWNQVPRGTIWAADTCQCSWTLEEAMSSSSEYNSAEVFSKLEEESDNEQPSQQNSEHDSESESGSEGSSLQSVVTGTFYPQFPTHNFQKPYLSKRNFKGPEEALQVINERFHINKIHQDILVFPNLANDYIYKYTFVHSHLCTALLQKIDQRIAGWNALQWYQYALQLNYSMVEISPYLLTCIL